MTLQANKNRGSGGSMGEDGGWPFPYRQRHPGSWPKPLQKILDLSLTVASDLVQLVETFTST